MKSEFKMIELMTSIQQFLNITNSVAIQASVWIFKPKAIKLSVQHVGQCLTFWGPWSPVGGVGVGV